MGIGRWGQGRGKGGVIGTVNNVYVDLSGVDHKLYAVLVWCQPIRVTTIAFIEVTDKRNPKP